MKKTALLLILALIFSQNAIYSAAIEKVTESRGYISASAEKDKDVYPNVAEITFTKENTAKSIDVASQENKAAMSAIQNALSSYQNENTEIRTGSYSATPNYVYKSNKKQLTGYTVINSITVKTKSTDKLGKMVDAAIKAGADRVGSLGFSYQNDGTVCKDLIFQATKEAQEIANLTAKTTNQVIKGVKYISTSCYIQQSNSASYRNFAAKAMSFGASADTESAMPETSITPGKIKVRANVNAEFYVK